MENNIICFATYNDLTNAYLVKNILESNDIFSFIENENITTANPFLTNAVGGIRLMINENDLEIASSLINKDNTIDTNEEENSEIKNTIFEVTTDVIRCPKCSSTNTWKESTGFIFSKDIYHCFDCSNEWK